VAPARQGGGGEGKWGPAGVHADPLLHSSSADLRYSAWHTKGGAHARASHKRAPTAAPPHQRTAWPPSRGGSWQAACGPRALPPAVPPAPRPVGAAPARRRVLDKLCVGSLEAGERVVAYEEDLEDGQFFAVLKKRVEKYFRGNPARARARPPGRARAARPPAPLIACLRVRDQVAKCVSLTASAGAGARQAASLPLCRVMLLCYVASWAVSPFHLGSGRCFHASSTRAVSVARRSTRAARCPST